MTHFSIAIEMDQDNWYVSFCLTPSQSTLDWDWTLSQNGTVVVLTKPLPLHRMQHTCMPPSASSLLCAPNSHYIPKHSFVQNLFVDNNYCQVKKSVSCIYIIWWQNYFAGQDNNYILSKYRKHFCSLDRSITIIKFWMWLILFFTWNI